MKNPVGLLPEIGNENPFFLIAGPCVIESYEMTMHIASTVKKMTDALQIPFVFKASFDKANRTSHDAFRGPGEQEGLAILKEIKKRLQVAVLTDIHHPEQAERAAEVADVIQIPAFLCRQTDLISAAAQTGRTVNIKKGQFMAPWDMKAVAEKAKAAGASRLMLTERGASFGYNNLVVDMQGLLQMKEYGYPVVFDATHSVQAPGAKGKSSGGSAQYVPGLARAAMALGLAGIFLEVHPNPEQALSDSACMLALDKLPQLLDVLIRLDSAVKSRGETEQRPGTGVEIC